MKRQSKVKQLNQTREPKHPQRLARDLTNVREIPGMELPIAERVALIRQECARQSFDGLLVPHHPIEFPNQSGQVLAFATGFGGTAGLSIFLPENALFMSDFRYKERAAKEVDGGLFDVKIQETGVLDGPAAAWLGSKIKAGWRIGFDPWLRTPDGIAPFRQVVEEAGGELVPLTPENNPVDLVWGRLGRPVNATAKVLPHPLRHAGKPWTKKVAQLVSYLRSEKIEAIAITTASSIAWLLNIRCLGELPFVPFFLGKVIVTADGGVYLYGDESKGSSALRRHFFNGLAVEVEMPAAKNADGKRLPTGYLDVQANLRPANEFERDLRLFAGNNCRVQIDPALAPCAVVNALGPDTANGAKPAGASIVKAADPCQLWMARLNATELKGMRYANLLDSVALVQLLAWLRRQSSPKSLPISEMDVVRKLEALRAKHPAYSGRSFPTISSAGKNGAYIHREVDEECNCLIRQGDVFLLDLGAHYADPDGENGAGTTDTTRTVLFGKPGRNLAQIKDRYTRILKGHIAISRLVFPAGTRGRHIDAFARQPLWQAGLDFDHGTGHGVGAYADVHGGPQKVNKNSTVDPPLEPGMVLSDEPGFYKSGRFGFRIENLLAVTKAKIKGAERKMLGFETLTFVPYDRALIDTTLLTAEEIGWIDRYHALVWEKLRPLIKFENTLSWLDKATRPLAA